MPSARRACDVRGHLLRRAERHRDVERVRRLAATAEERADGQAGGLAEQIPAGDVQRALGVSVSEQRSVQGVVDDAGSRGSRPEQRGPELAQRRARALPVRRQVRGPERAVSPKPSVPSSAVMRTTVLGRLAISRPPDITYVPWTYVRS